MGGGIRPKGSKSYAWRRYECKCGHSMESHQYYPSSLKYPKGLVCMICGSDGAGCGFVKKTKEKTL